MHKPGNSSGSTHGTLISNVFTPLFIIYCLCWVVVHIFRRLQMPLPFFNGWLTDFIFIPMIAHIALIITQTYVLKDRYYRYPLHYLLLMGIYISVVFEVLLPMINAHTTRDPLDVCAYFGGGIYFHIISKYVN